MSDAIRKEPLVAATATPRAIQSIYPEPFASRTAGRLKRPLGDPFGLTTFGVNHTRLAPGAMSALRHVHSRQDELVYVLEGRPTLITGLGVRELAPGMCIGFKAADGNARRRHPGRLRPGRQTDLHAQGRDAVLKDWSPAS